MICLCFYLDLLSFLFVCLLLLFCCFLFVFWCFVLLGFGGAGSVGFVVLGFVGLGILVGGLGRPGGGCTGFRIKIRVVLVFPGGVWGWCVIDFHLVCGFFVFCFTVGCVALILLYCGGSYL